MFRILIKYTIQPHKPSATLGFLREVSCFSPTWYVAAINFEYVCLKSETEIWNLKSENMFESFTAMISCICSDMCIKWICIVCE